MASNQVAIIALVFVGLIALVALIKGAARTFRRNWILALLLMLLLTPIWVIWAIIEALSGPPSQRTANVLPEERLPSPLVDPSSVDLAQRAVGARAERAREAIMASGNQQLIDHLNLLDAVGIAAATPTASASSVQQAVLPSQPDRSVPAKELSGWEKRQAVADQRKKDYPLLFGAAKVFLLGVVSLFAYSMWTVYQVRNSAEYSQCLSALLLPTDEQVDTCQRETRLKLYGR